MLCVLITNPFNYLLDFIYSSDNDNTNGIQSIIRSRTLQSETDNENCISSWKQIIAWILNISICLVCFVKFFIHGESIIYQSEMDEYYSYKKKADQYINEVYYKINQKI
jgi:hypothetical protein